MPRTSPKIKKWYGKWWGILIISCLILFIVILAAFIFQILNFYQKIKSGEIIIQDQFTKGSFENQSSDIRYVNSSGDDDPYLGNAEAKLTIIVFSDFECPYSKEAFPIVREIAEIYKDQIKIIFRDFPLSDIHPGAKLAALAGNCAHEQGKFWPMHDKIFQNQENLTASNFVFYAAQIGLDEEEFSECLNSKKYEMEVTKDIIDGAASGVRGTPTWFINGQEIEGVIPIESFKKIIDYFLGLSG